MRGWINFHILTSTRFHITYKLYFKGQLNKNKQIGIYLLLIIVVDVRWRRVKSDSQMSAETITFVSRFDCLLNHTIKIKMRWVLFECEFVWYQISHKDTDSVVFYHYLVACIQHTILAHTCILDESDQHNIQDYNFLLGVEEYRGLYTWCI